MVRFIFVVFILLSVSWGKLIVTGKLSSRRDDAYSMAVCPIGYVVSHCEVYTGKVHYRSDGAYISGRACVAVNGWGGSGAIARAVCSRNRSIYNMCKRTYMQKFLTLHSQGPAPRVSCPSGYKQILCNAYSPWLGFLNNKGVNSKGIIPNDRSCSVSRCSHKNYCKVTAVCQAEQCSVKIGRRSGREDDAESRAVCPSGYVVSRCEVLTGKVDYGSDGAFVDPQKPRICVAVNGWRGSGAVARAECSVSRRVYNRCKGAYMQTFLHLQSVGRVPSVSCPRGYHQILCSAHSPWYGNLSGKGVNQNGIIANHRRCRLSNCSGYCRLSAVCRINDNCT